MRQWTGLDNAHGAPCDGTVASIRTEDGFVACRAEARAEDLIPRHAGRFELFAYTRPRIEKPVIGTTFLGQ